MLTSAKSFLGRSRRLGYVIVPAAIAGIALGGVNLTVAFGSSNEGATQASTSESSANQPMTELGAQTRDTGTPLEYARGNLKAVGKGIGPSEAVMQVLRGLGSASPVRDVSVRQSPNGPIIEVALKQSNDDVADVWAAGMAVGAVGELMHTDQIAMSQVIAHASAAGPGKDGPRTWTGVGLGAVRTGQIFNSPSDAEITEQVEEVAQTFGLTVADIQIWHPLESALQVTFRVPAEAKVDWTLDQLRAALVGKSPTVEGVLVEIDSEGGLPLVRSGVAYRTGEGGSWCAKGNEALCGPGLTHMPMVVED